MKSFYFVLASTAFADLTCLSY